METASHLPLEELLAARLNRPVFSIQDGVFTFGPGDPPRLGDDLVGPKQHPFLIPLARVVQLEDLRRFITEQPQGDWASWAPFFASAYAILDGESLPLLASRGQTGDALQAALYAADAKVAAKIVEGAAAFASARGLTYRRAMTVVAQAHLVPVSFQVSPPGATVSVIPSTFYTPDDRFGDLWLEVSSMPSPRLGGTYYYKAKWPDGFTIGPTQIRVDQSGTIITIQRPPTP